MSMKKLVLAVVATLLGYSPSHAINLLRYALIADAPSAMKAPPLAPLISPATNTIYVQPAEQAGPVVITGLEGESVIQWSPVPRVGKVQYGLSDDAAVADMPDDKLMNWTPLSVEAFDYDITQEMWQIPEEDVSSWSVVNSGHLDKLFDIRPYEPTEPEVYTFGGLAFSR